MAEHCFTKARLGPQIWTWFWSNWKHQKNTHDSSFEMIFRFWSWLPNCIHLVIGKMCTVILAKFKVYTGKETTFSFERMKKILKKIMNPTKATKEYIPTLRSFSVQDVWYTVVVFECPDVKWVAHVQPQFIPHSQKQMQCSLKKGFSAGSIYWGRGGG